MGTCTQGRPGIRSAQKTRPPRGRPSSPSWPHSSASIRPGVWPSLKWKRTVSPRALQRSPSTRSSRPLASSRSISSGMKLARSRGCGSRARRQCSPPTTKRALGNSSRAGLPSSQAASRPPAWSKCRWLSTTTSMSSWEKPASARESSSTCRSSTTPKRSRSFGSKKAPMPASNSTVLPFTGVASSARQASSMRLSSSGGDHFCHMARGALPNMAPPSRRCEFPRMDQSFMAAS